MNKTNTGLKLSEACCQLEILYVQTNLHLMTPAWSLLAICLLFGVQTDRQTERNKTNGSISLNVCGTKVCKLVTSEPA